MMPEDDFDLVLFFDGTNFPKGMAEEQRAREIRSMADELSRGLKKRHLFPCVAGVDYYDLSKVKLNPRERWAEKLEHKRAYVLEHVNIDEIMDPFWLFHGCQLLEQERLLKPEKNILTWSWLTQYSERNGIRWFINSRQRLTWVLRQLHGYCPL